MRFCLALLCVTWLAACGGSTDGDGKSGTGGASTGGANVGGAGGSSGASTGGSGGSLGGSSGTGGYGAIGGTDGGSSTTCLELNDAYIEALAEAKFCNPLVSALQCTQLVNDKLACACSTYVNPASTEGLGKMYELQEKWNALGCDAIVDCPAIDCAAPKSGGCQINSSGSDGHCEDYFN